MSGAGAPHPPLLVSRLDLWNKDRGWRDMRVIPLHPQSKGSKGQKAPQMSPEHIIKTKLDEHWFVFWLYMWVCLKTGELKDPFRCLVGDQCTPGPPRHLAKQASLLQNHCTKAYAIWELRKMDPIMVTKPTISGHRPLFCSWLEKRHTSALLTMHRLC